MGYVKDTKINQFVPVGQISKSAGTWTPAVASNVVSEARTAAAASFDLMIPVVLPSSEAYRQGAKLKSITVYYKIGTAAATDFATVALNKMTLADPVSGEAVTVSIDADHDTAAERKTVDDHVMVVTLDTPLWIQEDEAFYLQCTVSAAATTVFTLYGAVVGFEITL